MVLRRNRRSLGVGLVAGRQALAASETTLAKALNTAPAAALGEQGALALAGKCRSSEVRLGWLQAALEVGWSNGTES